MNTEDESDFALVARAVGGDASAVEAVVLRVQDLVYALALRFLWNPADAADASQEILVKVITRLETFRGESALSTWVYRLAVNHLIDANKSRAERREISFEDISREFASAQDFEGEVENRELVEIVKTACTHGMLLGLEREQRMAFLLGTVFELRSEEAAEVLGISADAYRQRLSRARRSMEDFMQARCGLVNAAAACRCDARAAACATNPAARALFTPYLRLGEQLKRSGEFDSVRRLYATDLNRAERLALIYQTNVEFRAPAVLLKRIQAWFRHSPMFRA